jgi:hypothetical protein
MKTAMQELVEHIQINATKFSLMNTYNILKEIEPYLEKEKEQIMNAYEDGYEACDMDEAMEVNKKLTSGDLYYNMNYNQNK